MDEEIISFLNSNLFLRIFNLIVVLIILFVLIYTIIRLESILFLIKNNDFCALCENYTNMKCYVVPFS